MFLFCIFLEIQNFLYGIGIQYLNFWSFGTIFSFLLMKKYFPYDIYRHHKLAIIFISITISTFILICSFLPNSPEEGKKLNTYQKVEKEFGSYYYSILFILLFILVNFIYAYSINFSKVLIQIKNMSLYKLIIFMNYIQVTNFILKYLLFILYLYLVNICKCI